MNLDTLLQRADVWRGGEHSHREKAPADPRYSIPTGVTALDAQLPGGGWPLGMLAEMLLPYPGIGELQLLMPVLAQLTRNGRRLIWIAPPYLPYAPALVRWGIDVTHVLLLRAPTAPQQLWAMEQALRAGVCGAVLAWPHTPDPRVLRRLQLAAEAGQATGILFRSLHEARHASPAGLRIELKPAVNGCTAHIRKRRGGWHTQPIFIHRRHALA